MTDNTSSEGQSKKTNFSELGEEPIQAEVRNEVCRDDAKRKFDFKVKDYSQWFPGVQNKVADALSRDDDRSDEDLTKILKTFCTSQIPSHFKSVPLPAEISSYLISVLQKLPVKAQLQEKHTRTKIGCGPDGNNIVNPSDLRTTSTSTNSQNQTESGSWEPLSWLCAKGGFQDSLMVPRLKAQSEVPVPLYHHP